MIATEIMYIKHSKSKEGGCLPILISAWNNSLKQSNSYLLSQSMYNAYLA